MTFQTEAADPLVRPRRAVRLTSFLRWLARRISVRKERGQLDSLAPELPDDIGKTEEERIKELLRPIWDLPARRW